MTKQRVILDAALDRSVIRGTVIATTGEGSAIADL
jgi:hypothetical protein